VGDPAARSVAAAAASFEAADRYVLFELTVAEARCIGYGDVTLPDPRRWRDPEVRATASATSGPVTSEPETRTTEPATAETSKPGVAKRGAAKQGAATRPTAKRGVAKQGAAKRATSGRGRAANPGRTSIGWASVSADGRW
jgi:hypothetical protein